MGIDDRSFLDLIQSKVRSWVADLYWVSCDSWMSGGEGEHTVCHDCQSHLVTPSCGHHCLSCGRVFCVKCMYIPKAVISGSWGYVVDSGGNKPEFCKFCFQAVGRGGEVAGRFEEKKDQTMSPRQLLSDRIAHLMEVQQSSSLSLQCSTMRSYGEDDEDCVKQFLSPSSVFSQDVSDLDTSSFSTGIDFYSFRSSPLGSPSRADQPAEDHHVSLKPGSMDQESANYVRTPRSEAEDTMDHSGDYAENNLSIYHENPEVQQPFDFENNVLIWHPPPPKDEADDMETGYFEYDDEDDDVGAAGLAFKACSFDSDAFLAKEKPKASQKELLKASVHGHFRALVAQFLKIEGVCFENENQEQDWLEIVSSLAWQAANFVKPDTTRGGSMDPGDYVKVKCVSTGNPKDSTLVKGVVCTRNVKHKRMVTQHTNPKVLILGGALEYQKVPTKLASINTVLEQESDHLKMAFSKIEAHRPNILLVEKSVSPYAVEYMLVRGISLVSNVKRSLLERIARCTGARIIESTDDLPSARLGHCEAFYIERVPEECSSSQPSKKSTKTLMYFDGCPRRLGCTVLLRGACHEKLKKVKNVIQYASFAAYHLSLETSFLADEGATLPEMPLNTSNIVPEGPKIAGGLVSTLSSSSIPSIHQEVLDGPLQIGSFEKLESFSLLQCSGISSPNMKVHCIYSKEAELESSINNVNSSDTSGLSKASLPLSGNCHDASMELASCGFERKKSAFQCKESDEPSELPVEVKTNTIEPRREMIDGNTMPSEYFLAAENNQSILVSLSKSCVLKGTTCERSQLFRIKFYGSFDKPLGRYLREDLFDQTSCCQSCKEPADVHVLCYTHQHGSLTISVKRLLPPLKLPGEHDGRIWMWHRCLKCTQKDGVPPAARRVIMSDAAWGLSFGKFLELSFSNHSTANRVASCGHSLQRDCLRFYGSGNMVAFFRYSPVDILLVHLPSSVLEFTGQAQQEWFRKEAMEVSNKMESLYTEVFDVLHSIEQKTSNSENEPIRTSLLGGIRDLKEWLRRERNDYDVLIQQVCLENTSDILELNNLRRSLLIDSHMWDWRIYLLDSMHRDKKSISNIDSCLPECSLHSKPAEWSESAQDGGCGCSLERTNTMSVMDGELVGKVSTVEGLQSTNPNLSDKIDLAWIGSKSVKAQIFNSLEAGSDNPQCRKLMAPVRVYSLDSALRKRERTHRLSPNLGHLSSVNSSDSSGDLGGVFIEGTPNIQRVYSQSSPKDAQNLKFLFGHTPSFVKSSSHMVSDGARLLLLQSSRDCIVVAVYDNEPSSIISYAISSKEHADFVAHLSDQREGWNISEKPNDDLSGSQVRSAQPALQTNQYETDESRFSVSEEASRGNFSSDPKQSHFRFLFDDDSSFPADKVKFSVTCYFAKKFYSLRKKCCPNEIDFIRSFSRCKKWSAQGGKSNVYFAKSLDERFIIKQVTRTELDSFEEFAPQYFEYLTESINSGSPTCLAKVLGIYQVTVKHLKGGREVRMELMVMENLFYGRSISRVYDLKGSSRSRYIPDTTGSNKVLLDLNLLETLRTNPIFLGSKAKRRLERAVWNDTAFLASIDVMDYSLLVGVDNERKELVIGIIDFMRQYTWDKQLETWVKASGILGGPKNVTPTVISPKQYKKRFRKAMSSYFLTVPDQWSS